jgi:hypothetical protein
MSTPLPLLEQVRVASPCPANWDDMTGDDRTRFCGLCQLSVHNISEMTATEAEAFLRDSVGEKRTCIRLYRRADGTILTSNCPVGLRAARDRMRRVVSRVAAAVALLVSSGFVIATRHRVGPNAGGPYLSELEPFRSVARVLTPRQPSPRSVWMGERVMPRYEVGSDGRFSSEGLDFSDARDARAIERQIGVPNEPSFPIELTSEQP